MAADSRRRRKGSASMFSGRLLAEISLAGSKQVFGMIGISLIDSAHYR
jgi:hypothetical protein